MKLKFCVKDHKEPVVIDVDLSKILEEEYDLLRRRMFHLDVDNFFDLTKEKINSLKIEIEIRPLGLTKEAEKYVLYICESEYIEADEANYASLIEVVKENQREVDVQNNIINKGIAIRKKAGISNSLF